MSSQICLTRNTFLTIMMKHRIWILNKSYISVLRRKCHICTTKYILPKYEVFAKGEPPVKFLRSLPSATKLRQVIFSQASVSHSVHGGGGVCFSACWIHPQAGTPPGRYTPRQVHPQACTPPPGRYIRLGRYIPPGRYTPPSDGHCTDGTHPTGMLSRLISSCCGFFERK